MSIFSQSLNLVLVHLDLLVQLVSLFYKPCYHMFTSVSCCQFILGSFINFYLCWSEYMTMHSCLTLDIIWLGHKLAWKVNRVVAVVTAASMTAVVQLQWL